MNLLYMNANEPLIIDAVVSTNQAIKERLISLGIFPNQKICIKRFGLFKSTLMIAIGGNWVGLRKSEAQMIDVHLIPYALFPCDT